MSYIKIRYDDFTYEMEKSLTIKNPAYIKAKKFNKDTTGITEKFLLFSIIGDFVLLPRYALGNKYSTNKPNLVPIEIKWQPKIPFSFNKSQSKTISNVMDYYDETTGANIVAETGEGKSAMAVRIITLLKQKTLILCYKDTIIDQWKDIVTGKQIGRAHV